MYGVIIMNAQQQAMSQQQELNNRKDGVNPKPRPNGGTGVRRSMPEQRDGNVSGALESEPLTSVESR